MASCTSRRPHDARSLARPPGRRLLVWPVRNPKPWRARLFWARPCVWSLKRPFPAGAPGRLLSNACSSALPLTGGHALSAMCALFCTQPSLGRQPAQKKAISLRTPRGLHTLAPAHPRRRARLGAASIAWLPELHSCTWLRPPYLRAPPSRPVHPHGGLTGGAEGALLAPAWSPASAAEAPVLLSVCVGWRQPAPLNRRPACRARLGPVQMPARQS